VRLRFSQLLCVALLAGALLVISDGYAETKAGLASWYGPGFEGQPTASGEPFDPHGFTAAHNTLPLGTELVVSYGGRSVKVVVNDRGPYSGGRELDLSQGAAEYLGLTYAGVDYVDYAVAGGGGYGGYGAEDPAYAETDYAAPSASEAQYSSDGQGTSGGTYVVQAGDTLSSIAAEHGTTVEDLAAANGIQDPNLLYAGQTLSY
jgi:peptidoglycan lytic transglycosylase